MKKYLFIPFLLVFFCCSHDKELDIDDAISNSTSFQENIVLDSLQALQTDEFQALLKTYKLKVINPSDTTVIDLKFNTIKEAEFYFRNKENNTSLKMKSSSSAGIFLGPFFSQTVEGNAVTHVCLHSRAMQLDEITTFMSGVAGVYTHKYSNITPLDLNSHECTYSWAFYGLNKVTTQIVGTAVFVKDYVYEGKGRTTIRERDNPDGNAIRYALTSYDVHTSILH